MRRREADVFRAWDILGVNSADREKVQDGQELVLVADNVQESDRQPGIPSRIRPSTIEKKARMLDAFALDVRARTVLGIFVLGMQQMSGIDGILYVSWST